MKKVFTWKLAKSLQNEYTSCHRLYINNRPTWFILTLECILDMRSYYALDLECEIALLLQKDQKLTQLESYDAIRALSTRETKC